MSMGLCQTETCVQVNITDDKKLENTESFMLTLEKLDTTDSDLLYLYEKILLTPNKSATINITDNEPGKIIATCDTDTHNTIY